MVRTSTLTGRKAEKALLASSSLIKQVGERNSDWIAETVNVMLTALRAGRKILFCGNGGSAADAQHLAAELGGRFYLDRRALAAVALTTNSSIITAVGNDLGFENIFSRQVEAIGNRGDILVAITTSGRSENMRRAVLAAKKKGLITVCLTGAGGRPLASKCDLSLVVPSLESPRIQEAHIAVGHTICWLIESALFGKSRKRK